ncbi:autotransporter outer membrane beta-barrel domain-containing protein [Gilliamella sp. wkB171]|uniref:autotransporter outer membrane beta-barrel domain-containing protein n=1 Tax=Gilliamella sp. wkB171 TaxID=3120258 RepID=UPI00081381E5|nr:autotransporter outer membrane beta-barrel domain-containing protein [Gilliamella apicola]OCL19442.1 hypothetical protein A9G03_06890 [Gilliamella apicola]
MNLKQRIKIALGVGLFTPLTTWGLDVNGNQVVTEEINVPTINSVSKHNGDLYRDSFFGIAISEGSNVTFDNKVMVNLSEKDINNVDHNNFAGILVGLSDTGEPQQPTLTIFNNDVTVNLESTHYDDAVVALNSSTIIFNGTTRLSMTNSQDPDERGSAIYVDSGSIVLNGESHIIGDIYANDFGTITIKNRSIINGDIFADENSLIDIELISGSRIEGKLDAYSNGILNLKLAENSQFIGTADSRDQFFDSDIDDKAHPGFINIDLSKGALWNILDREVDEDEDQDFNSYITQLSGAGSVTFDHNTQTRSPSFKNLTVENLKGALTFTMSTDIAAEKSDKLIIKNSAEGHHTLNLINNGAANTNGKEKLTLVDIDENATSTAEFKTDHQVELGGYKYHLTKDGNNWVLVSNGTAVTNTDNNKNPDKNDNNTSSKPQITTTANASAGFLNANYLMSYVETQTLLKRLGDMRNSGTFGDVWLRGFSGKLDSFSSGKLSKFDMNYHGFQFGADKQLLENTPFVIGAFVGQTYGDPDYRKGDGSLRSFNTGLYTTYLDESGFYLDGVAKYARQKNHFKVRDTADNRVQGTGHTNGLGVSLELGKKYQINDFYIEPQTQIAYSHQNGTSINATNGLNVKLGNYNSLIGRASALFGYQVNTENSNINLYAKTGIVREFDGDTYYKLNGNKESHSFEGNWWNNSIGVSAQVNKAHTIYLDVESSTGNRFNLLQVNGGYRYSF